MKAKVVKSGKKEFSCVIIDDKRSVVASARGNLLKNQESIVVGDWVELLENKQNGSFEIMSVEKRMNEIYRIFVRETRKKIVAANCDLIVVVTSVSLPPYKRGVVERFLVRAQQWGIDCVVVFNKMDQWDSSEFDLPFEMARLKTLGVEIFEICAKNPDFVPPLGSKGLNDLRQILQGKTSIFMGQSGVGKSKMVSVLTDGQVNLKTQEVGKVGRGVHTTTWSEIIDCGEFFLIDSPGMKTFSLDDIAPEQLIDYFPDLQECFGQCRFSNCQHLESSKGCAFVPWRQKESLEAQILLSRLDSYLKMVEEISQLPHWEKKSY